MALFELIFFTILLGYIFFRLWSVLGSRTGNERPPNSSSLFSKKEEPQDNVIVLKERQKDVYVQDATIIDQEDPFKDSCDKIRKIESDFDLIDFQEKAKIAFEMVINAFVQGDRALLTQLLDKSVYKQFETSLKQRETSGQTIENEIVGPIDVEVLDVACRAKIAEVTLRFKSRQRYITRDQQGHIIDNFEEEALKMTDIWTFKRNLGGEDPTWLLSETKSES